MSASEQHSTERENQNKTRPETTSRQLAETVTPVYQPLLLGNAAVAPEMCNQVGRLVPGPESSAAMNIPYEEVAEPDHYEPIDNPDEGYIYSVVRNEHK